MNLLVSEPNIPAEGRPTAKASAGVSLFALAVTFYLKERNMKFAISLTAGYLLFTISPAIFFTLLALFFFGVLVG